MADQEGPQSHEVFWTLLEGRWRVLRKDVEGPEE